MLASSLEYIYMYMNLDKLHVNRVAPEPLKYIYRLRISWPQVKVDFSLSTEPTLFGICEAWVFLHI